MNQTADRKKLLRYFSLVQLIYCGMHGWSFCNLYFRDIGFNGEQIGMMAAAGKLTGLFLLPVMGLLSDRRYSPRRILLAMIALMIPLRLLLPVAGETIGAVFSVFLLLNALNVPMSMVGSVMLDAWSGDAADRIGLPYGSIRLFGSIGYVAVSLINSALIGKVLPSWSYPVQIALMMIPSLLLIGSRRGAQYTAPSIQAASAEKPKNSTLLKLVLRNYYFIAYLLLAMAYYTLSALCDLDITYLLDEVHVSRSLAGVTGSCRAGTEAVVMLLLCIAPELPPRWILLSATGILTAAGHFLYIVWPTFAGVVIADFIFGIAGGIFFCVGTNYVFDIVDRRATATALSVVSVILSLVGVAGAAVGGMMIEKFGVFALTTTAGIFILILSLIFIAMTFTGRVIRKRPFASEVALMEKFPSK